MSTEESVVALNKMYNQKPIPKGFISEVNSSFILTLIFLLLFILYGYVSFKT